MDNAVLIGGLSLTLYLNIFFAFGLYRQWIKKDKINTTLFIHWKGTKKNIIWFVIWSVLLNLNLLVFVSLNLILQVEKKDFIGIFFLSYVSWGIILGLAYIITVHILKNKK